MRACCGQDGTQWQLWVRLHHCYQLLSRESRRERNHLCSARGTGGSSLPLFSRKARSSTSPDSGNRPASLLEKSRTPSTITSNWPRLPSVISTFSPQCFSNDAAKLTARSLYPQALQ